MMSAFNDEFVVTYYIYINLYVHIFVTLQILFWLLISNRFIVEFPCFLFYPPNANGDVDADSYCDLLTNEQITLIVFSFLRFGAARKKNNQAKELLMCIRKWNCVFVHITKAYVRE